MKALNPMELRRRCLWRGLRKRCPQCGASGLYLKYAKVRRSCSTCGLILRREQGAQTGAMYLTAAVCQVFAISVVWIAWMFTDWDAITFIGVAAPLVLIFCVAFLPFSQSLWIAVEYITDAINNEEWVELRD